MTDQTLLQKYVQIFSVVAAYWFISITLGKEKNPPPLHFLTVDVAVFVNKSLLSGSLSEAPLFVTWYQCVVTVLGCYVLRQAARYLPGKISFPELDLDVNIMKEVMM